jgi:hypothetical protein
MRRHRFVTPVLVLAFLFLSVNSASAAVRPDTPTLGTHYYGSVCERVYAGGSRSGKICVSVGIDVTLQGGSAQAVVSFTPGWGTLSKISARKLAFYLNGSVEAARRFADRINTGGTILRATSPYNLWDGGDQSHIITAEVQAVADNACIYWSAGVHACTSLRSGKVFLKVPKP